MIRKWSELFPDGRYIFYEGDDPESFVKEMKNSFGLNLTFDWDEFKEFNAFGFHCPSKFIDEIYGNGKYPMGS